MTYNTIRGERITESADGTAAGGSTLTMTTPWDQPGALCIRKHTEGYGPEQVQLDAPVPADLDANAVDEGFVAFITRYAQRVGHLGLGPVFVMAEAWGIEIEGSYALCSAADPNIVIWPGSSMAYLSNLIYLIQHDPEALGIHETSEQDAAKAGMTPAIPMVDTKLYNSQQRQTEPRWLPAVFCADREGIGKKTRPTFEDAVSLLAESVTSGEMRQELEKLRSKGIRITVAAVDKQGNTRRIFGDAPLPDNVKADPSDEDYDA